ncbi:MAG: PA14 domain-containing protein [Deltaproteobacteria bacterium]
MHKEIRRELGQPYDCLPSYLSQREAEEQHRQLWLESSQRSLSDEPGSWLQRWRQRLPQWTSWTIVTIVVGGLLLRYALAILDRTRWQHEHPEGNWISRYYSDPDFKDFLLSRYDVAVSYSWGRRGPSQAMARDQWSATWDTCMIATAPLELELRLVADDAGKFILDDSLQIRVRGRRPKSATVSIAPGVHHLRVEYQERRRGSKLQLQGLEFAGTGAYRFQRPHLEGVEMRCEEPAR